MNKWILLPLLLVVASVSYAVDTSWSKTTTHYTIYMSGGWATMPFSPPSSVPISGTTVTSVSYQWSTYPNGNSSELVEICYSNPNSSTIQYCHNISASQTGTVHFYDGFSARGTFWIRHTLTGGTYPATANSRTDSVTVNYHY